MSEPTGNDISFENEEGIPLWSSLTNVFGDTGKTVVLRPKGEPTLRIGAEQDSSLSSDMGITTDGVSSIEFVGCSRSLPQAPRFFNALFFGNWVVDLSDDCPEPMYILLAITHNRIDDLPTTLSIVELEELLIQAEKYDLISLLGPWLPKWLDPNMEIDSCEDKRLLAWIAWKTGAATLFVKVAVDLAQTCRLDEKGGLVDVEGVSAEWGELDNTGFTNIAKRVRLEAIDNVLKLLEIAIEISFSGHGCPYWYDPTTRECPRTLNRVVVAACRLHDLIDNRRKIVLRRPLLKKVKLDRRSYRDSAQEKRVSNNGHGL
ncbi:hypothetical protein LZ31DRAFT_599553 [Colletotrichum somersetense]|nr:hypothetical protein LZ31DRAFT_599553 [Colletotrichum somersetense]